MNQWNSTLVLGWGGSQGDNPCCPTGAQVHSVLQTTPFRRVVRRFAVQVHRGDRYISGGRGQGSRPSESTRSARDGLRANSARRSDIGIRSTHGIFGPEIERRSP